MTNHETFARRAHQLLTSASRRALGPTLALAVLALPSLARAEERAPTLSLSFTPVLVLPSGNYHLGGGADPELRYTVDLGSARLSAGARVGAYYAKDLFGVTLMPTLRLTVPLGDVEPYVAFGMGYGWLPKIDHADIATMSRVGFVYRFSESFAIGLEGTLQKIERSDFRFPSIGSMVAFDL